MLQGIFNKTIGTFFSSLRTSSPRTTMSAQETVEKAIAGNKIVIFSKSYCPFCKKAKDIINTEFPNLKDQIYTNEYAPRFLIILSES
jgi:hypothetical protein